MKVDLTGGRFDAVLYLKRSAPYTARRNPRKRVGPSDRVAVCLQDKAAVGIQLTSGKVRGSR